MAASSYGSTDHSEPNMSVRRSSSFDLYEDDNDDYEYLPLPDVDEDFLDSSSKRCSLSQVPKKISFNRIYQSPVSFDSQSRQCFLPGQKIQAEIIKVDQSDHTQLMNPNLYFIKLKHGEYEWLVKRRYKHFRSLHDSLFLFKTKAMLPLLFKETSEEYDRRKSAAKPNQKLSRFPKRPEPLVRSAYLEERRQELESYLQSLLRCAQYRNHPETLRFLEVSHLSFVNGLGPKNREGMVEKRSGGRRIALHCFSCCLACQPGHYLRRWLVLKDTFLAYIRPEDGTISDVLLMDKDFNVSHGLVNTGIHHGLLITNLSRHLSIRCWTQRKTREWYDDIQRAVDLTGKDYIEPNRYSSFVPVRRNSYVNWFVDGASYMAAVADALEAAKEEIFITDWMLSPELYLKRPMLEGDRWRLDVILKRKAEEGVKIFVLVYKEMEMALGINSYHTKQVLTSQHPENIRVMRHPDGIKLWSHHEKCVVIDQRLAFLGGIDLCYGRWDTRKHRLTDLGSCLLSNIFGNQDSDTLENLLSNVPNIVPKPERLSPIGEQDSEPTSPPSVDDASHQPVNLRDISLQGQDSVVNESDINANNRQGSVIKEKDGGYSNPIPVNDSISSDKTSGDLKGKTAVGVDNVSQNNSVIRGSNFSPRKLVSSVSTDSSQSRRLVHQKTTIDEDFDPSQGFSNTFGSDSSLNQTANTLQAFLRNATERQSNNKAMKLSVRNENLPSGDSKETEKELENAMKAYVDHTVTEKQKKKPQRAFSDVGSQKCLKPSPVTKFHSNGTDPSNKFVQESDDTQNGGIGSNKSENEIDALEKKPDTPPPEKRKLTFKTVAGFKIMLQRQQHASIDVTDDESMRPWDEKVFQSKENDVADGELDDRLSTFNGTGESLKIWVGKDYTNFINKDFVELDKPFTDFIDRKCTPRMPWHDIGSVVFGKPGRDVARHFIQRWNFTKLQKKKTNTDMPMLLPKSNENVSVPRWVSKTGFCCDCQILRSASEWSAGIKSTEESIHNAYTDLILNAKHYVYIENQFFITIANDKVIHNQIATALYERIIEAHRTQQTFRVYIVLPLLPAFEGQLGTPTGSSIQAIIYWNYASICRGENSLLERLLKTINDPFQYISFYGLRKHEEMMGKLTTELVYVHSKLMIVDDQSVIIGSANINDRSMLGNRDSELAILVTDTCSVPSHMNGEPYKAGAFACSLRKSLFREHLGDKTVDVSDPVSNDFYKNVWLRQASINTTIYDKVFSCIPTDGVATLNQLRALEKQPPLAEQDPETARIHLQRVKGHLVLMPLQFLANENLAPNAGTKEALIPTVIWT